MSKIADLRAKAAENKRNLQAERVTSAVKGVVNSDAFMLSMMNSSSGGVTLDDEKVQEFAQNVANVVVQTVTDPVQEFYDVCQSRGVPQTRIKKLVNALTTIFNIDDRLPHEERLRLVAIEMQGRQYLYGDIVMLSK